MKRVKWDAFIFPKNGISNQLKWRKTTRISNKYNQVPHLSQDTQWGSNKITIDLKNKSQEVSPFPSGDNKAAMNRRESMASKSYK